MPPIERWTKPSSRGWPIAWRREVRMVADRGLRAQWAWFIVCWALRAKPEHALVVRGHLAIVADARIDAKDDLLQKFDPGDRIALRAATDTELILSCYQRWGDSCLDHLVGDFSFAIWDNRARSLLLRA